MEFASRHLTLTLDGSGLLRALVHRTTGTNYVAAPGSSLWRLSFRDRDGHERWVSAAGQRCDADVQGDTLVLQYGPLDAEGEEVPLMVQVWLERDDASGGLLLRADVENRGVPLVTACCFPVLGGLGTLGGDPAEDTLLWPQGAGVRIARPLRTVGHMRLSYPGRASMAWYALSNPRETLAFFSLDETLQTTELDVRQDRIGWGQKPSLACSFSTYPFLRAGGSWHSPPYLVTADASDWHAAARRYRSWAHQRWYRPIPAPAWLRRANGFQLVILKQQNREVLWRYADLPRLYTLAQRSGADVLLLFGWFWGGHDNTYPDAYEPDEAMGGREGLQNALRRVRAAGGYAFLYYNGQLLDTASDYYMRLGYRLALRDEQGRDITEQWRKFLDAPPHHFARACLACPAWQEQLEALCRQAHALGAQGAFFDQIGGGAPSLCFDAAHPHATPALAVGPAKATLLPRLRALARKLDPDFVVGTEHFTDAFAHGVDFVHGAGPGYQDGPESYPALTRYTFPETIVTNRHPSPRLNRRQANFAVTYGFRIEYEIRYRGDGTVVTENIWPGRDAYANVCSLPDVAMLEQADLGLLEAYARALGEMRHRNSDLLLEGTFMHTDGFELDSEGVIATAFVAQATPGDVQATHRAVVLWNPTAEIRRYRIAVPGLVPVGHDAPAGPWEPVPVPGPDSAGTAQTGVLPPQGLLVLRYTGQSL
jgi:hypothetical protein